MPWLADDFYDALISASERRKVPTLQQGCSHALREAQGAIFEEFPRWWHHFPATNKPRHDDNSTVAFYGRGEVSSGSVRVTVFRLLRHRLKTLEYVGTPASPLTR